MAKCKIMLADTELSYLMPIELTLSREHAGEIELSLVTDAAYLHQYFQEPQKLDILVISERLWSEDIRRHSIGQLFILLEETEPCIQTEENDIILYKYTSARDICASINVILRHIRGSTVAERTKLIMVYSPQGGSGKTTTALGVCAALVGMGSRTLYINEDSLQVDEEYPHRDTFMSDTLLQQLINGNVATDELRKNITGDLFDCIAPMQYAMTSYGIREESYLTIAHTAVDQLSYDYVVVDCSCDFTPAKSNLMRDADYVVLPFAPTGHGRAKYRRFCQCVDVSDRDKFVFVRCLRSSMEAGPSETADLPVDMCVPFIPDLRTGPAGTMSKLQSCSAFNELIYRFL
ncbi:MAG TPA: AAA family ATPase [Candidatus Fournierella merdigallinarum]|nr:AAA family ATPase [Candidatus Fournierella merdigallinarum]